jgi:hypothetical protein
MAHLWVLPLFLFLPSHSRGIVVTAWVDKQDAGLFIALRDSSAVFLEKQWSALESIES